jgi:hypothetical protein
MNFSKNLKRINHSFRLLSPDSISDGKSHLFKINILPLRHKEKQDYVDLSHPKAVVFFTFRGVDSCLRIRRPGLS